MLKINDLLKEIAKKLKDYPNLKCIILYGSYARGEAHKDSDIDLLIVLDVGKPIKELDKIYSLYENVIREGIVLYGKFDIGVKELKLSPYRVINYNLAKSKPRIKVMVSKRVN